MPSSLIDAVMVAQPSAQLVGQMELHVRHIFTDSRQPFSPKQACFVALRGPRYNGHDYVETLLAQGVRQFVVEEENPKLAQAGASYLLVENSLQALQQLASAHRATLENTQVVAITGSNGKTITKEWLFHLLSPYESVMRSPKSYNSQVGVPLSIFRASPQHNIALLEAGISEEGEMETLGKMIQPQLGICTYLGSAHLENFFSQKALAEEKVKLFDSCETILYPAAQNLWKEVLIERFGDSKKCVAWGDGAELDLQRKVEGNRMRLQATWKGRHYSFSSDLVDGASIFNLSTCLATMAFLEKGEAQVNADMAALQTVQMRLQLLAGRNGSVLVNDSYSADLDSLEVALTLLNRQPNPRVAILSDFEQSPLPDAELYASIARLCKRYEVDEVMGIGKEMQTHQALFGTGFSAFDDTEAFLSALENDWPVQQSVLVKGARSFGFERIVKRLEAQGHETVLETHLDALIHNLNTFRARLKKRTKVMAMVKAFGYGSGAVEVANVLAYHHVDYFAVAYTDEGVQLRQGGIETPIMVLNPEENSFAALVEYNLEPEIYSPKLLRAWLHFTQRFPGDEPPIHIKLDTGMHRLGFEPKQLEELCSLLRSNPQVKIASVLSHLAAADDPALDDFTAQQIALFEQGAQQIASVREDHFLKHIANTAGAARFAAAEQDMVRIGIGLYGGGGQSGSLSLQQATRFYTRISQVKDIKKGESVGYRRSFVADRDMRIATIPVGYADGLPRSLGQGKIAFLVNEKPCPTVGNICMDMCMLDISQVRAEAGDKVLLFGPELPVEVLAKAANTISYEILAGISGRVKRVFLEGE